MTARTWLAAAAVLVLVTGPATAAAPPRAPISVSTVHHDLHGRLAQLAQSGGDVGKAARELDKALLPHIKKEEAFALPPLSLLGALADGAPTPAMAWAVPMADRLKAERPKLITEHKAMAPKIDALRKAGGKFSQPAAVRLADEILAHFRQEEEVLYPAVLLVGQRLRQKK